MKSLYCVDFVYEMCFFELVELFFLRLASTGNILGKFEIKLLQFNSLIDMCMFREDGS